MLLKNVFRTTIQFFFTLMFVMSFSIAVNAAEMENTTRVAIDKFVSNYSSVESAGQRVFLNYETKNAIEVYITGMEKDYDMVYPLCGDIEVFPDKTTTYTLVATGKDGTQVTKNLTVNVNATETENTTGVTIDKFVSNYSIVESAGQRVVLSYETKNAIDVYITGMEKDYDMVYPLCGDIEVFPDKTTTYTLVATGKDGTHVTKNLTVTVDAPLITSFSPSNTFNQTVYQDTISKGQMLKLSWSTASNVTNCRIETSTGQKLLNRPVNGSIVVSPSKTTTYTLNVTDAKGQTASKSVTVIVK